MTAYENLSVSQKLRATLHCDVKAICLECCHLLGLEITKPATEVIAELLYKKLCLYGSDMELFAKHAKRNTINSEDVKLLIRRNPTLKSHINKLQPPSASKEKSKKQKTVAKQQELSTTATSTATVRTKSDNDDFEVMDVNESIDLTDE